VRQSSWIIISPVYIIHLFFVHLFLFSFRDTLFRSLPRKVHFVAEKIICKSILRREGVCKKCYFVAKKIFARSVFCCQNVAFWIIAEKSALCCQKDRLQKVYFVAKMFAKSVTLLPKRFSRGVYFVAEKMVCKKYILLHEYLQRVYFVAKMFAKSDTLLPKKDLCRKYTLLPGNIALGTFL
jgi:hypothetical protein